MTLFVVGSSAMMCARYFPHRRGRVQPASQPASQLQTRVSKARPGAMTEWTPRVCWVRKKDVVQLRVVIAIVIVNFLTDADCWITSIHTYPPTQSPPNIFRRGTPIRNRQLRPPAGLHLTSHAHVWWISLVAGAKPLVLHEDRARHGTAHWGCARHSQLLRAARRLSSIPGLPTHETARSG